MTPTELLIAEALLAASPAHLHLIKQWMTEKLEKFSLRELQVEIEGWYQIWRHRALTDVEHLLHGTCLALIDQAQE